MENIKITYFLLFASFMLLILNIVNGFMEEKFNYFGIISNILLILSMAYNVYNIKKNIS